MLAAPEREPAVAHVAVIMDGNRRWAAQHGLPIAEGYRRGISALRAAVRGALDCRVGTLTVYGFSTENWRRDAREIHLLMQLCAAFARSERASLARQGVRVKILGDVEPFAPPARAGLASLVRGTEFNSRLTLNLALNYSGRTDILRATRSIAREVAEGALAPEAVDEAALRARLYDGETPDPDLLIRTGGDCRISNFLLYQLAYTELVMLDVLWPDFDEAHFARALSQLRARSRRFGA